MTKKNNKYALDQLNALSEVAIALTEHMNQVMANQNVLNRRLEALEQRQDPAQHNELTEEERVT